MSTPSPLRTRLLGAATTVALVALPALALANEGHGHEAVDMGQVWHDLAVHGINLVVLLGILGYVLKDAAKNGLINRAKTIRSQLAASAEAMKAAQAETAALETRLANFDAELAELKAQARADATFERERIIAHANKAAETMVATARQTIQDEVNLTRQALRAEAVELAVDLATQRITETIATADHKRLVNSFIEHVEGQAKESARD